MVWAIALLIAGLAMIIKGGDLFVDAATWLAERTGIPKFVVGATVVSLATTMPELIVSVMAASAGQTDMAVGNAVGSVTVNTSLILGIALLSMPGKIPRKSILLRSALLLASTGVILLCALLQGALNKSTALFLLALLAVFFADSLYAARQGAAARPGLAECSPAPESGSPQCPVENDPAASPPPNAGTKAALWQNMVQFVAGTALLVLGSRLLIDNGSALATLLGVPEGVIAVTVVALGTSLPELVTTITSILKKERSLSVGNIIGANILNMTLIMPLNALVCGQALPISAQFSAVDIPFCLLVCAVATIPALATQTFGRRQGACLVVLYAAYLFVVI